MEVPQSPQPGSPAGKENSARANTIALTCRGAPLCTRCARRRRPRLYPCLEISKVPGNEKP